jgi:purine nucleoside phosphorylase
LFYLINKGMSTSHEATTACYCGLKVLAFSIVTDMVTLEHDIDEASSNHDEIVKMAKLKSKDAVKLVSNFIERLSKNLNILN